MSKKNPKGLGKALQIGLLLATITLTVAQIVQIIIELKK